MPKITRKKPIIAIDHISFSYGENEILRDISLTINRGEYVGLVGGNGSGKTTLLRLILRLLQPTQGTIRLFGEDIRSFKAWERVGYVPQKVTAFDQNFPATVEEVVLMGRYSKRGLFRPMTHNDREKATEALIQVDMLDYRHALIGDLSGGQQQRVFIARALAGEPEILFLDEPTVGVDQEAKDSFYDLLQRLNHKLGMTIVLVTHDLQSIAQKQMRVACLDCTLQFHESVEAFFKSQDKVIHSHP